MEKPLSEQEIIPNQSAGRLSDRAAQPNDGQLPLHGAPPQLYQHAKMIIGMASCKGVCQNILR
jgi:hypothetical protein